MIGLPNLIITTLDVSVKYVQRGRAGWRCQDATQEPLRIIIIGS